MNLQRPVSASLCLLPSPGSQPGVASGNILSSGRGGLGHTLALAEMDRVITKLYKGHGIWRRLKLCANVSTDIVKGEEHPSQDLRKEVLGGVQSCLHNSRIGQSHGKGSLSHAGYQVDFHLWTWGHPVWGKQQVWFRNFVSIHIIHEIKL